MLGALCLSLGSAQVVRAQPLHTEGGFFRDEAGAVVMLRGLNVAGDSKVPPFRPVDDPALFDPFPEWGVNVARLLFTWEAFEGEREVYDESYFDYYRGLVDALAARGVWTIVDFHQDAFSRFSTDGCGEGMPRWAVTPDVMLHEPDNGPDCAGWGLKFILDGDTHKTWDAFYADTHGVRTRYLALMDVVSERLGSHPAVIGYDIINEPWGDEVTQIGPLQADAERLIRANDPDSLIFVSPQALTSAGQDTRLVKPAFDNYAYSPHYYDGAVIQLHRWLGGSLKDPVERMYNQARAWGVPLFVGEFGAPGDGENVEPYMAEFYAQLDQRFISAAQWSWVAHWDEVKKDGWNTEDFSIVEGSALRQTYWVRPYPARIAGTPGTFAVTRGPAAQVRLSWTHEPALGATRLFAPFLALFAAQAFVETDSDVACSYEADRRHLRCTSESAGDKSLVVRACAPGEACTQVAEPEQPELDAGAGDGDGDGDGGIVMEEDPATAADASVGPPPTVMPARNGCALGTGAPARSGWLLLLAVTWLRVRRSRYNTAHE